MLFARLRYELQLMGWGVVLAPVITMVAFALLTAIFHLLGADPARMLVGGLEMLLPLIAGVVVATIASQDRVIEVQLTLPRSYALTVLRRIALIVLWTACIALILTGIFTLLKVNALPAQFHSWSGIVQAFAAQLVWISPLLWFTTSGLLLALLLRSRAASNGLLCGIWIVEILARSYFVTTSWLWPFYLFTTTLTPYVDFWLLNRVEVIGTALLVFVLGGLLLRHPEGLLKAAGEE